ncbi:hypothetical protein K7X08_021379 [Anisodus acutangulus]|uniref:SPARK domain-containing protein n=1 Tax=Anisodus acutangulus TaxID=402998 RepID=A0A9Q1M0G9_9SOLA|nr:hypothetical protein K7X08_021379 [Anisodus acutangulus]
MHLIAGSLIHQLLVVAICVANYQNVVALHVPHKPSQSSSISKLASPPKSGVFEPIEIPPAVIPPYPFPGKSLPPMYPSFPKTYDPVLTGRCPVNFSVISSITEKTASDCTRSLSTVVGNVICYPQFNNLIHIFQGFYSNRSDTSVLQSAVADDFFRDIISMLASKGANSSISGLCSVKSSNLTGGSCPVKDIEAALLFSGIKTTLGGKNIVGVPCEIDTLNECKGVVYSWIARKQQFDDASFAFRLFSSCKANKVVIWGCSVSPGIQVAAPSPSCCSSLTAYIAGIQKQMLITNRQAIICAAAFGSMLQKAGVMTNVYELCDIDLKDLSLQGFVSGMISPIDDDDMEEDPEEPEEEMEEDPEEDPEYNPAEYEPADRGVIKLDARIWCGTHYRFSWLRLYWLSNSNQLAGCLLRSYPTDLVYDKSTGFSFTCDLNDNIAAPWPSSSIGTSLSLCALDMSLLALPTSETLGSYSEYLFQPCFAYSCGAIYLQRSS